jgi:sugar phosphate isomerase/epimerase
VLPYLHSLGIQAVELGTGSFTNGAHCDPAVYLDHPDKIQELNRLLSDNEMIISALSCHGNPVHPDGEIAQRDHQLFVDTVRLAAQLGVKTVVTFSGCPGDSEDAKHPNWVTCAWPPEYSQILQYQWDDVLIPYWQKAAKIAEENGVQVAIEMHPGFAVYNPETMMKLRNATSPAIGANFDPSHLFWQGVDPVAALRYLGDAVHYFHAKDCYVDPINRAKTGVLDTKHYGDMANRAWTFRTVGYGHSEQTWRDMISTLRLIGYDDVISIEHEDAMMPIKEGLEKAVRFLSDLIIQEKPAEMWWA